MFAAIDACCLIDLLATGRADAILRASGHVWRLPIAVQSEVQYVRKHDPSDPGKTINDPVDLTAWISSGLLNLCQPDNEQELDAFMNYAAQFRSDGEAMCLALAECRGWAIATDDRKAIRVAKQAGAKVISSPALIRAWADTGAIDSGIVRQALLDVEDLARFCPSASMLEHDWWEQQIRP